jgi:peroxiredoxin Q/BCP
MAQEGNKAPDLALPMDNGETLALPEFKGRPGIICFSPKDDTAGCTREAKACSPLANRFARLRALVIGISPDSIERHARFRNNHGLTIEVAGDVEQAAAVAYVRWLEKSTNGRKYTGVERTTFRIDGKRQIARSWHKATVPGHAGETPAALCAPGD